MPLLSVDEPTRASAHVREGTLAVRALQVILSFVAGAVDSTTFLALSGMFAAHVTGNFVVLAVGLVSFQGHGVAAKLLALPVFLVAAWLSALFAQAWPWPRSTLCSLLLAEALLMCASLAVGYSLHAPVDADSLRAMALGMLLVAAMGVQSALGQLAFPKSPATTAMTTNVSRLAVELARRLMRRMQDGHRAGKRETAPHGAVAEVIGFVIGCGCGAIGYKLGGFPWLIGPLIMLCVAATLMRFT